MKKKSLYIIMIIAVILGAIIVKVKGFNYSTLYSNHKRIEIIIGSEYDLKDVKKIADEATKSDNVVRKSTLYGTSVSIDAKELSDDEITSLFAKLNEKYSKEYNIKDVKKENILQELEVKSIDEKTDDEIATIISQIKEKYGLEYTADELKNSSTQVKVYDVPRISVFDTVKNFVKPLIISLVIVMVYMAIRYHSLYKKAWILEPLRIAFELILNEAFILAVIAIVRIPVGMYVPTILLMVWLLQLLSETMRDEAKLKEIENAEEK